MFHEFTIIFIQNVLLKNYQKFIRNFKEKRKIRLNINEEFEIVETPFAEEFGKKQNQKLYLLKK